MARTPSRMRALGSELPRFELVDWVSGQLVNDEGMRSSIVVVAFICNHCPFVVHLKPALAKFGEFCRDRGVKMVAINSNDASTHPADAPERMAEDARDFGYVFPYLFDEDQSVALAFGAVCTPDFFVYDSSARLAYRGQFDDSRPDNGKPVTGHDLRAAISALLAGASPQKPQKPSIGCNIKWRPENDPNG